MPADALMWAYGVVPDAAVGSVEGLEGRPVEPVAAGELAVLASPVSFSADELRRRLEDIDALETLARAHDAVLEAAFARGDVVPFRMCTLYESPDAIRDMLAAEGERFAGALSRLRGKAEWGVKGYLVERRDEERPASGAEYLLRRRAQRERGESSTTVAAEVHARLAERASAAVVSRPHDRKLSGRAEEMILNGAYLVPRDASQDFAALVDELRSQQDVLALELTGPWPPYHFAA